MKKITSLFVVSIFVISKLSAQFMDSTMAASLIVTEAMKIQYVYEGEIVKIDLFAGDFNGSKLTKNDVVYNSKQGQRTYRQLSDGGGAICYSIATIKVCQVYKGLGISDTIRVVTATRGVQFIINVSGGGDTTIDYYFQQRDYFDQRPFFDARTIGLKEVFFGYNHNYSGMSSQIKTLSRIGGIEFHDQRYDPTSPDPYDRIYAGSTGLLFFAHPSFYSRQELMDSLENMPLLMLNVNGDNACLPLESAQKKSEGTKERPLNGNCDQTKSSYLGQIANLNIKRQKYAETLKQRGRGLKRSNNTLIINMVNPRITGLNPNDVWFEFDITASSNVPSLYLDEFIIILTYDTVAFGNNLHSSGGFQGSRLGVFNTPSYYGPVLGDLTSSKLQIVFITDAGALLNRVALTTSPQKVLNIRMKITIADIPAALKYSDTSTVSVYSYYTATPNAPWGTGNLYDYTNYTGSNNDRTGNPIIVGFNDTVPAGTGQILTIRGRYFGDSLGNKKTVIFRNANRGDVYPVNPNGQTGVEQYDILSWSHDTIKIRIPGIIDSISKDPRNADYMAVPGSGKFMVKNRYLLSGESSIPLTIPYAVYQDINYNGSYSKIRTKLSGANSKVRNGYTVHINKTLDSIYPAAKAIIRRAMRDWSCVTGVTWELGSDTTLGAVDNDGFCVIALSDTLNVLMETTKEIYFCPNTSNYYMNAFDIKISRKFDWQIDSTQNLANSKYDFYACVNHEFGHAHLLRHVNSLKELMYQFSYPGFYNFNQRITLSSSDDTKAGGNYVTTNLATPTGCGVEPHTVFFPDCSQTNSIEDVQYSSKLTAFPNPISGGYLTIMSDQIFSNNTYFEIVDVMGRVVSKVMVNSMIEGEYKIPVDNLSSGIYLLQIVSDNMQQSVKFVKQ